LALASGFLSAAADRFGWWGAAGTKNVGWGNFDAYTNYLLTLAPYLPARFAHAAAWGATMVEMTLGVALLLGVALRRTALASAATLFAFAASMFFFSGFEAPLSASVFSAAAAALLLALCPSGSDVVSIDRLLRSRRPERKQVNMTLIDKDIRDIVDSAKLGFVATVNPDGSPNLSPKGSVRVYDDEHVAFMDIASPATVANLSVNPHIEIAVVDFLRRRGYRFSGTAELQQPGSAVHTRLHRWLLGLNGPGYPANQAVLVNVERVRPILSPAYTYGGADEHTLVERFSATYLPDTNADVRDQPAGGPPRRDAGRDV
jgi:predicted pyridoxine 5'-phosphate oxidase superfamily flavin-nucleotide-binding protein/uncharacterized membrane protein YphA (DoxX/SURF4 family)